MLQICLPMRLHLLWVRCKAAEALGAIGSESFIPLLKNSLTLDPAQEFRETCELALSRIEDMKNSVAAESSPFLSIDLAAPASCSSVKELREIILNENKSMYERYAALFSLRNLGDNDVISAIIESLGEKSALLRHESRRKRARTPTPGHYLGLKSTRGDGYRGDRGGSSQDDYGYQMSSRRSPYKGGCDYSTKRSPYGSGCDYSLRRSPTDRRPRRDRSYSP